MDDKRGDDYINMMTDQLHRDDDDDDVKKLTKDDGYDSISFNSLNTCSDIWPDPSHADGHAERVTPSSEERTWMKDIYLTNESIRLSKVLSSIEPSQIKDILLARLRQADPEGLVALGILFPRARYPYQARRHCVECRKAFDSLCQHPGKYVQKLRSDRHGSEWLCHQCNSRFLVAGSTAAVDDVCSGLCKSCVKGSPISKTDQSTCVGIYRSSQENDPVEFYV